MNQNICKWSPHVSVAADELFNETFVVPAAQDTLAHMELKSQGRTIILTLIDRFHMQNSYSIGLQGIVVQY
jgi:hypothetical protein